MKRRNEKERNREKLNWMKCNKRSQWERGVRSFFLTLFSLCSFVVLHSTSWSGSFSCVLCSVLFIWFGYNETKWKREPNQRRRTEQQHTPPVSRRVVLSFPLCIQFNSRFLSLPLQLNWIQRENKGHTRTLEATKRDPDQPSVNGSFLVSLCSFHASISFVPHSIPL